MTDIDALIDLDSVISIIKTVFNCSRENIRDICLLKKGMTNRSVFFSVNREKFILRIPGEGTDELINRFEEADVYKQISGLNFCDDPIYIDPKRGYKITRYLENVSSCNPYNKDDVAECMELLKKLHNLKLEVSHRFDVFDKINFYEHLLNTSSLYCDYKSTKNKVFSLKKYIDSIDKEYCLSHIDSVPDNFLFYIDTVNEKKVKKLQLTDWEYAGMQDPHIDIAMFCIYSLYDKSECDRLIDIYFDYECRSDIRAKIYCYISICGLLWSNWCEYKQSLGIEFGDYPVRQYNYAKDFYDYAIELIKQESSNET